MRPRYRGAAFTFHTYRKIEKGRRRKRSSTSVAPNLFRSTFEVPFRCSPFAPKRLCGVKLREPGFAEVSFSLVGSIGLEPTTPTMSRWCSNQLSYEPERSEIIWSVLNLGKCFCA